MKRKFLIILSLIASFCFSFFGLAACREDKPVIQPQTESKFKFIDAPSTLVMGETKKLSYVLDEEIDETTLTFESSNTNVAKIDSKTALVEAINVGQTVIASKYADAKTEFTLNVVKDDGLPQFLFNNYVNEKETQELTANQKLNLGGYIFYNGKNYHDAVVTYSLDNPDVASVAENGTLTANKAGETVVTVTATWRDMESPLLTKEIVVKVVNDMQILINDGDSTNITVYSKAAFGGRQFATSFNVMQNVKLLFNDEDMTASTIFEVVDNEAREDQSQAAVSYDTDAKVITANKAGTATLRATFTKNGETLTQTASIVCEKPIVEYSAPIYFSQVDGDIVGLDEMFGEETTLVEAYQSGSYKEGAKLTLNGNKITDYRLKDKNSLQADTISLYTEDCGILVNVNACYKVIREAKDLTSVYGDSASSVVDGYFLVANDIPYDASVVIEPTGCTGAATGSKFAGVFDGGGHTINFGVTKGGLFGQLTGTVKNGSFVVKAVGKKDYASNVIFASYMAGATVTNVYATYDIANFTPDLSFVLSFRTAGLGLFEASNVGTLKDVIVDLSKVTLDGTQGGDKVKNYGVLFCPSNSAWYYGTATNTHVIWGEEELHFYNGTKIAYAESDSNYTTSLAGTKTQLKGVARYDTLAAMAGAVTKVGDFKIAANGITWDK